MSSLVTPFRVINISSWQLVIYDDSVDTRLPDSCRLTAEALADFLNERRERNCALSSS